MYPALCVLLRNKRDETYNRLFRDVVSRTDQIENNPMDILTDFEKKTINVIQKIQFQVFIKFKSKIVSFELKCMEPCPTF